MSNKNVVEKLKEVLADTYILYLKTQNYHWNVTGPNFKSLHKLFEVQYKELANASDVLAERIRALDEFAPGSFMVFSDLTEVKEETREGVPALEMLRQLVEDHEVVVANINKAIDLSQKANDDATADILISRVEAHDKSRWMLRSSL